MRLTEKEHTAAAFCERLGLNETDFTAVLNGMISGNYGECELNTDVTWSDPNTGETYARYNIAVDPELVPVGMGNSMIHEFAVNVYDLEAEQLADALVAVKVAQEYLFGKVYDV